MISIFKHELKLYSHSLVTYVFGAFLLAFVGLGAMIYNIEQSVSNFEYVLDTIAIVFIILVPILTMRVISEEKKQKTDQLLYSLPISSTDVVVGKFLSMAVLFLVPTLIICFYPLIFNKFGDVYLPVSYISILGFFFLGLALISIGEFVSSLTESQGIAAGICVVLLLFNYYSATLAEYVSATSVGALVAILVVVVIIGLVVKLLTKSNFAGLISVIILAVAILVAFFVDQSILDNLLPTILHELSLFERFEIFVNGIFDIKVLFYDISVIIFFLFLTVQSLEKRRYN